jgi:hypothetical protein
MAKWHVRVSQQSCKQANRLILWGVGGAPQKKILIFLFFSPKKLEKYDLTRPQKLNRKCPNMAETRRIALRN